MLHDFILHCLVFKEQSPSLISATRLLYRIDFFLSRTFFKFFLKIFLTEFGTNVFQPLATQGLLAVFRCRISQRLVL